MLIGWRQSCDLLADDAVSLFHLLRCELPLLFGCVLHANIILCVETFSLGLETLNKKQTNKITNSQYLTTKSSSALKSYSSKCRNGFSHHSSQCDKGWLDLGVIHVLKKVVGFKDVMWFQAIITNGSHKLSDVLQLREIERGYKGKLKMDTVDPCFRTLQIPLVS